MPLSSHQESPLAGERNRVCEIRGYVTIVSRNRLARGWSRMSGSELSYCGNRHLRNSPLSSPVASLSHQQACSDIYSRRVLTRFPPSHSPFLCLPAVYVAFSPLGFFNAHHMLLTLFVHLFVCVPCSVLVFRTVFSLNTRVQAGATASARLFFSLN
jgi:hypothetical protein